MSCSICGKNGHNARTCPYKNGEVPRNHALWLKFDNMTEREATDLQAQIIKDKSRIAPKSRGTAVKGNTKDLPSRVREALRLTGGKGKNGSKKK